MGSLAVVGVITNNFSPITPSYIKSQIAKDKTLRLVIVSLSNYQGDSFGALKNWPQPRALGNSSSLRVVRHTGCGADAGKLSIHVFMNKPCINTRGIQVGGVSKASGWFGISG